MKNLFLFIIAILQVRGLNAQNIAINNDGSSPDASSLLDIKSTSKGILVPRMTMAQRDAIVSPQNGLMIFQTDQIPGFYYNAGTSSLPSWKKVGGETSYPANAFSYSTYYAPGDYTFNVPANVYKIFFEIGGGGGGYGGSYTPAVGNLNGGGGGGAGGFAGGYFSVTPGELIKIHVGVAGSNGTGSSSGGTDGTGGAFSSIVSIATDTLLRVNGGNGGKGGTSVSPGNGGLQGSYFNVFNSRVVFGLTSAFSNPTTAGFIGNSGTNPFTVVGIGGQLGYSNFNRPNYIFIIVSGYIVPTKVYGDAIGGGNGSNPSNGFVGIYW